MTTDLTQPKQPWDWTEEDLVALIANGIQESLTLDYKASEALARTEGKKRELTKDVSSFANSAGGVLVYGMVEEDRLPVQLDAGLDPNELSREWIEQVINSSVHPRIDGLRIAAVPLRTASPGRVAYVVAVPQSLRAPHMAADNRYYKRFNFESVPMEDYEVRDVLGRRDAPLLRLRFGAPRILTLPEDERPGFTLPFVLENSSPAPAEYAITRIAVDARIEVKHSGGLELVEDAVFVDGRTVRVLIHKLSVPHYLPVWEGMSMTVNQTPIELVAPDDGEYAVAWEVLAPRMVPQRGEYRLEVVNGAPSLREAVAPF